MARLSSWPGFAADQFYPRLCRSCGAWLGRGEELFCANCAGSAVMLDGDFCTVCARPFTDGAGGPHACGDCISVPPPFARAMAPYIYEGVVKDAIHIFKYDGMRAMEGFLSGAFEGRLSGWFGGIGVVAAVPLHKKRLKARGFNQSLLLARSAARMAGVALSVDGLVRTRNTPPQIELSPREREANVRGAFAAVRKSGFAGRDVLLVDDVYTTGATVRECARVLRKAGAARVCVLTVARAAGQY